MNSTPSLTLFCKNCVKMIYKILNRFPFLDPRILHIKRLPYRGKLLDMGCGNGNVLRRFQSVRPDIKITGIDREDFMNLLPDDIIFHKLDVEKDCLPFPDNFFDGVSIIHVIEHLRHPGPGLKEIFRVLKEGESFYIETPHIKSLSFPSFDFFPDKEGGPLNFYDDFTHVRPYGKQVLRDMLSAFSIEDFKFGTYRNYVYTLMSPFLIIIGFILLKRRWVVVGVHNLFGWSAYCMGSKGITCNDSNR